MMVLPSHTPSYQPPVLAPHRKTSVSHLRLIIDSHPRRRETANSSGRRLTASLVGAPFNIPERLTARRRGLPRVNPLNGKCS